MTLLSGVICGVTSSDREASLNDTEVAPLALDSRAPSASLAETLQQEPRFKRLERQLPEIASQLYREAELDANRRFAWLSQLAGKEAPAQE